MFYVLSPLLVLGVVILVHELGHYLVARWLRVKSDRFSLGFGSELFGATDKNGTRWRISALPLGGYVRFARLPDEATGAKFEDGDYAFDRAPLGRRAAIVFAGPLANFVFSMAVFAVVAGIVGVNIPKVKAVSPGSPAEIAGVRAGDTIVGYNNNSINDFAELAQFVSGNGATPIKLKLDDGSGAVRSVTLVPAQLKVSAPDGSEVTRWQLGIQSLGERRLLNPLEAAQAGVRLTGEITAGTVKMLGSIFTGQESLSNLSGVVGIGKVSGDMAQTAYTETEGAPLAKIGNVLMTLTWIAAMISISIGLMNLLPIPMLDGCQLLYFAIEGLTRRPVSLAVQNVTAHVGIVLLLGLTLFVSWNDIKVHILG